MKGLADMIREIFTSQPKKKESQPVPDPTGKAVERWQQELDDRLEAIRTQMRVEGRQ